MHSTVGVEEFWGFWGLMRLQRYTECNNGFMFRPYQDWNACVDMEELISRRQTGRVRWCELSPSGALTSALWLFIIILRLTRISIIRLRRAKEARWAPSRMSLRLITIKLRIHKLHFFIRWQNYSSVIMNCKTRADNDNLNTEATHSGTSRSRSQIP